MEPSFEVSAIARPVLMYQRLSSMRRTGCEKGAGDDRTARRGEARRALSAKFRKVSGEVLSHVFLPSL
jgi:hypothetical protein